MIRKYHKNTSLLICIAIYFLTFLSFHQSCISRDLVVYGQYLESIIPIDYLIFIAPFIFSYIYTLQCWYLISSGFPYILVICYVSLSIFTIGVNQLLLSIAMTVYVFGIFSSQSKITKILSIAIHPSLILSLVFRHDLSSKIIKINLIVISISLWFLTLVLLDSSYIISILTSMPQKNISNFGYYLSVHYSSTEYYNYNKLSGVENIILFAAISLSTNKWKPFIFMLIAFNCYTLFDTIPQPMAFRLLELFAYLLLIHGYIRARIKYQSILFCIAGYVIFYKFGYVFGCFSI